MTTADPRPDQLELLASSTDGGPIQMLNLLRFRERAGGIDAADAISGAEAYGRYGEAIAAALAAVGGRVLTLAQGPETIIGPEEERWHLMILVEYPSRQAFLQMISRPDYQAGHAHRAAAVADSRLICCSPAAG